MIFIVGAPRTGTTWMWDMLTAHPQVRPVVSADFGGDHGIETGCFLRYSVKQIRKTFYELVKANPGKLLVEKTPYHIGWLSAMFFLYPGCRVVRMARNDAAVLNSLVHTPEIQMPLEGGDGARDTLAKCKAAFLPFTGDERILTVHYEGLSEEPGIYLSQVQKHCGLPVDLEALTLYPRKPCRPMVTV